MSSLAPLKQLMKEIESFYFNELLAQYPPASHDTHVFDWPKHKFELRRILEHFTSPSARNSSEKIRFLDVGGGMGINVIILSQICRFECYIIDRYSEFSSEHKRVVGHEGNLIQTLEKYQVKAVKHDFVSGGFPFADNLFDGISCFNVIEHFNFSPAKTVERMSKILKKDGYLFLSTPNQVHLFNRLKCLLGRDTWEEFDYYYGAEPFFGHVRELTAPELQQMIAREKSLRPTQFYLNNFPIESKITIEKSPARKFLLQALKPFVNALCEIFPRLNYYMIACGQKQ